MAPTLHPRGSSAPGRSSTDTALPKEAHHGSLIHSGSPCKQDCHTVPTTFMISKIPVSPVCPLPHFCSSRSPKRSKQIYSKYCKDQSSNCSNTEHDQEDPRCFFSPQIPGSQWQNGWGSETCSCCSLEKRSP